MTKSCPKWYKTLWEKEKLLVTSNFSFSHSVFKRLAVQTSKNQGVFGKELNGFQWDGFADRTTDRALEGAGQDQTASKGLSVHIVRRFTLKL